MNKISAIHIFLLSRNYIQWGCLGAVISIFNLLFVIFDGHLMFDVSYGLDGPDCHKQSVLI